MKMLEQFENELRNISVEDLIKAMRNAGVKQITLDAVGADIVVNAYGLVVNVPAEAWKITNKPFATYVEAKCNDVKVMSSLADDEKNAIAERYGVKFDEVEDA